MEIRLGNLQFNEIEKILGYKLTDDDKLIFDKYHDDQANLSGKESCFHIFDIPTCIVFKGEPAKQAIIKMFTPDKLVNRIGEFTVYEQK